MLFAVTTPRPAAPLTRVTRRHLFPHRPLPSLARGLAACLLLPLLLSGCLGGGDDPVTEPAQASAAIGPAGGTLLGPDGVELMVPAGALAQTTTLTITKTADGAPALGGQLLAGGAVYEFTPHGLNFAVPVTIGFPLASSSASATSTAVSTSVFMVSPGDTGWSEQDTQVINGKATVARNRLSWGMPGMFCMIYTDPSRNSPSGCVSPRGHTRLLATPSTALQTVTWPHWQNSAGRFTVNQAAQVTFQAFYKTVYHCANSTASLYREWFDPVAGGFTQPRVLLHEIVAPLTQSVGISAPGMYAEGTAIFAPVTIDHTANGGWRYTVVHRCTDPTTGFNHSGGDFALIDAAVPVPTITYSVGGSVSGLTGSGLVLQDNGGDNLAISADGAFTFAAQVGGSAPYSVTVLTQPGGQVCTVANGSGTANANVSNVAVNCAIPSNPINGYVAATASGPVTLQNNGTDTISIASDATFTFPTLVATGSPYNVTVLAAPAGQSCVVLNGSGNAPQSPGIEVEVNCTDLPPTPIALVANSAANTLSLYRMDRGTGALTALGTTGTGLYPYAIITTPDGRFAYVTNLEGETISSYSVNAVTGAVTQVGSAVGSANPFGIAMDPLGRFVWVANYSTSKVSAYTIDSSTGQLTAAGAPVATDSLPYAVAARPAGDYAYVANEGGNTITAYSVDAGTGQLTQLSGTLANSVFRPHHLVVDPSGQFVFVAESGGNTVTTFRIDPATGRLTRIGAYSSGSSPNFVAVHPNGRFVYAANLGSNTVSVFSINTGTGALSAVGSPVATGAGPTALTIQAGGGFLYVSNKTARTVSAFSVDSVTGALTPLGGSITTGNSPEGIAVTP